MCEEMSIEEQKELAEWFNKQVDQSLTKQSPGFSIAKQVKNVIVCAISLERYKDKAGWWGKNCIATSGKYSIY